MCVREHTKVSNTLQQKHETPKSYSFAKFVVSQCSLMIKVKFTFVTSTKDYFSLYGLIDY